MIGITMFQVLFREVKTHGMLRLALAIPVASALGIIAMAMSTTTMPIILVDWRSAFAFSKTQSKILA